MKYLLLILLNNIVHWYSEQANNVDSIYNKMNVEHDDVSLDTLTFVI